LEILAKGFHAAMRWEDYSPRGQANPVAADFTPARNALSTALTAAPGA
jgi:hypothetical protein